jgi:hypothetical protein
MEERRREPIGHTMGSSSSPCGAFIDNKRTHSAASRSSAGSCLGVNPLVDITNNTTVNSFRGVQCD